MVAGLGFPEEPEPVGGHVDDRGIRVCGQDSPGLGLQTAPDSRFRGCTVCRLTGRRLGSLAGRQFLRGVGECRYRRKWPLVLPGRCRGVIGLPIRRAALIIGCGVRPETGCRVRSFGDRRRRFRLLPGGGFRVGSRLEIGRLVPYLHRHVRGLDGGSGRFRSFPGGFCGMIVFCHSIVVLTVFE